MYTISSFCFICLSDKESLLNLFDKHKTIQIDSVINQIKHTIPEIKISEPDTPVFVCSTCQTTLNSFYNFKKMCLQNFRCFQKYIKLLRGTKNPRKQKFAELQISFYYNKMLKKNAPLIEVNSDTEDEDFIMLSDDEDDILQSFTLSDVDDDEELDYIFNQGIKIENTSPVEEDSDDEPIVKRIRATVQEEEEIEDTNQIEKEIENNCQVEEEIEDTNSQEEEKIEDTSSQVEDEIEDTSSKVEEEIEDKSSQVEEKIEVEKETEKTINKEETRVAVHTEEIIQETHQIEETIPPDTSQIDNIEDTFPVEIKIEDTSQMEEYSNDSFEMEEEWIEESFIMEDDIDIVQPDEIIQPQVKKKEEQKIINPVLRSVLSDENRTRIEDFLQAMGLRKDDEDTTVQNKIEDLQESSSVQVNTDKSLLQTLLSTDIQPTKKLPHSSQISQEQVVEETLSPEEQTAHDDFVSKDSTTQNGPLQLVSRKKRGEINLDIATLCFNTSNRIQKDSVSKSEILAHISNLTDPTKKEPKDYKCFICHRVLSQKMCLVNHLKRHGGIRDFPCSMCHKKFIDNFNLKRHIAEIHQNIKNYKCTICGRKFAARQRLDLHMKLHQDRQRFECNVCKKNFWDAYSLRRHLLWHVGYSKYDCPFCSKKFALASNLRLHVKVHSRNKYFLCTICYYKFKSPNDLIEHKKTHGEALICSICYEKFKTNKELTDHLLTHKPEIFCCQICNEEFSCKEELLKHIRAHKENENYVCTICNKHFTKRAYWRKHTMSHEEKTYNCSECNKKFVSLIYLNRHKQIHLPNNELSTCTICNQEFRNLKIHMKIHADHITRNHECTTCNQKFALKKNLMKHVRQYHPTEIVYTCEHCDKKFPNLTSKATHIRYGKDILGYECVVCHLKYSFKCAWIKHVNTHFNHEYSEDNPPPELTRKPPNFNYTNCPCTICDEEFPNEDSLREHVMSTHFKIYKCEMCKDQFTAKSSFQIHMNTVHLGIEGYECSICSRKFKLEQNVRQHMKSHGYRKYECSVCNKRFVTQHNLIKHMYTHDVIEGDEVERPDELVETIFGDDDETEEGDNKTVLPTEEGNNETGLPTEEGNNKIVLPTEGDNETVLPMEECNNETVLPTEELSNEISKETVLPMEEYNNETVLPTEELSNEISKETVLPMEECNNETVLPMEECVHEIVLPTEGSDNETVLPTEEGDNETVLPMEECIKETVLPTEELSNEISNEIVLPMEECIKETVLPTEELTNEISNEIVLPMEECNNEIVLPMEEGNNEIVLPMEEGNNETVLPTEELSNEISIEETGETINPVVIYTT